jgi:hypothetical protein
MLYGLVHRYKLFVFYEQSDNVELQLQIHKKNKQPTYTIEEKINRQNNGKFKNDKSKSVSPIRF